MLLRVILYFTRSLGILDIVKVSIGDVEVSSSRRIARKHHSNPALC